MERDRRRSVLDQAAEDAVDDGRVLRLRGVPALQPLQQGQVARDERLLLGARPLLQLSLARQGAGAGGVRLRVGKHYGPAARSEGTCTAIDVAAQPGGKVRGFANVQGSVRAAEDVDDMHDDDDGIVWATNASEDLGSPSTRSLRSLAQGILPVGAGHERALRLPAAGGRSGRVEWRRRELNPRPRKRRRRALRACLHSDVATGFERSQDHRPPSPICLTVTRQGGT